MLKDFDATKQQLAELADVINKFKSDAVQLRLIDLLFSEAVKKESEGPNLGVEKSPRQRKTRRSARARSVDNAVSASKGKKKPAGGSGPAALLQKAIDEGFFREPKTINAICEHSASSYARRIKPNEISGKLGRLVREKVLSRAKNSDGQYEYKKV